MIRRPRALTAVCLAVATAFAFAAPGDNGVYRKPPDTTNLPRLGDASREDLSPILERKLGEEIMNDIRRDPDYLDDDPTLEYLNNFGSALVAAAPDARGEANLNFFFFAVRDPMINAFALPGGFIGFNAGTLLAAGNESEIAGVLGHEMAHVTQRHIARAEEDTKAANILTWAAVLAAILAGSVANPDLIIAGIGAGQAINQQRSVNYTRAHEQEADRIGIQTMAAAGFDPEGMASFFGKLQQQARLYGNGIPEILLTHPLSTNRMAEARARAAELGPIHHTDSLEFGLMRARARVLSSEQPGEALDYFGREIDAGHNTLDNIYGLAYAQLMQSQVLAAMQTLAPLVDRYPKQANIQMLQADLLAQNGKNDAALDIYRRVLQFYPRYAPAMLAYAETLMNAGQPGVARQYLLSHEQTQGTQMQTYKLLAQGARESGDLAEAAYQMGTYLMLRGDAGSALAQIDAGLRLPDLTAQQRAKLVAKRTEVRNALPDNYRSRS